MRKLKQLTLVKRYQIAILRKAGHNQTQIARHLGVHKSTISRELRRNLGKQKWTPMLGQLFHFFKCIPAIFKPLLVIHEADHSKPDPV